MRRGRGFTIVELLVSLALILFLMSILSGAFVAGMKAFRDLKARGDLNERLRAAAGLLTADLAADHFEGARRLSDANFWADGPPREGYFRVWQLQLPVDAGGPVDEGADLDGNHSTRSLNTCLAFTVKKRGSGRQDFFAAKVPGGSPLLSLPLADSRYQDEGGLYKSQWAEVAWFVKPSHAFAGKAPLYALYRRQRVAVPDAHLLLGPVPVSRAGDYEEVSWSRNGPDGPNLYFNGPRDLTVPERRFGMNPDQRAKPGGVPAEPDGTYPVRKAADGTPTQADLVLADVLSFDVQLLLGKPVVLGPADFAYAVDFYDLRGLGGRGFINPGRYRLDNGTQALVFDTWTNADDGTYDYSDWTFAYDSGHARSAPPTWIPLRRLPVHFAPEGVPITVWPYDVQVLALKASIRVWDFKTEQARQVTVIQDL
jgi:prepilin-type N-terminal cleavage/methylation domain-containing protein